MPKSIEKLKSQKGFILIFSVLMILGISALAVGMIYNSRMNNATAQNYKNKIQSFYAADGMMSLLADEVLSGRDTLYTNAAQRDTITGSVYNKINSVDVQNFRSQTQGSNGNQTVTALYLGSAWLGTVKPTWSSFGILWKGYIYPPITGSYRFFVRGDDNTAFYLSTSEFLIDLPRSPTAYNYSSVSYSKGWPTVENPQMSGDCSNCDPVSDPISLKGGKKYYFEYYHTHVNGNDFGQVGWAGPEWIDEKPIPGSRLSKYIVSNPTVTQDDSIKIGNVMVQYRVTPLGDNEYTLFTQGSKRRTGTDTIYKIPLNQKISFRGQSSAPPDTLWSKVIFHDFHARNWPLLSNNPEFQNDNVIYGWGGASAHTGMVESNFLKQTATDANYFNMARIGKPINIIDSTLRTVTAADKKNVWRSCKMEKWFVDWTPGDFKIPRYQELPAGGDQNNATYAANVLSDCVLQTVTYDTAFKNAKIYDSLPLVRTMVNGTYSYLYERTYQNNKDFFPIDNRGFGNEGRPHNFSFCMEMHSTFEFKPGLTFDFEGDDDIWIFINGKLEMDLGGHHVQTGGSINMDALNLVYGKNYPFELFYCEMMCCGSDIKITTNLPIGSGRGTLKKSWQRDYGSMD